MLILMDRERNTWAERMMPGSLHYIPGGVAHRVANTEIASCHLPHAGLRMPGIIMKRSRIRASRPVGRSERYP